MIAHRTFAAGLVTSVAAVVLAFAAIAAFQFSDQEPRTALAGPCGEVTADVLEDDMHLMPGQDSTRELTIDSNPTELPDGKRVLIELYLYVFPNSEEPVDPADFGIFLQANPNNTGGDAEVSITVEAFQSAPVGRYGVEVLVECHCEYSFEFFDLFIGMMPSAATSEWESPAQPQGHGEPCPTPPPPFCPAVPQAVVPAGQVCVAWTPTPEPTPSPVPTPSPTPAPTPTGSPDLRLWADVDCNDTIDPVDGLKILRHDAGLSVQQEPDCPALDEIIRWFHANSHAGPAGNGFHEGPWGDDDCSDAVDPVDALKTLRYDAQLPVEQPPGCPEFGEEGTVQELG